MWIFAKKGFVSIVADKVQPHGPVMHVRGRIRGDIEALFPGAKVRVTSNADYGFRAEVPRDVVVKRVALLAADIDYPNFKDACPSDRHDPYLDIWTVMYREQINRSNFRRRRAALRTDWGFDRDDYLAPRGRKAKR